MPVGWKMVIRVILQKGFVSEKREKSPKAIRFHLGGFLLGSASARRFDIAVVRCDVFFRREDSCQLRVESPRRFVITVITVPTRTRCCYSKNRSESKL